MGLSVELLYGLLELRIKLIVLTRWQSPNGGSFPMLTSLNTIPRCVVYKFIGISIPELTLQMGYIAIGATGETLSPTTLFTSFCNMPR